MASTPLPLPCTPNLVGRPSNAGVEERALAPSCHSTTANLQSISLFGKTFLRGGERRGKSSVPVLHSLSISPRNRESGWGDSSFAPSANFNGNSAFQPPGLENSSFEPSAISNGNYSLQPPRSRNSSFATSASSNGNSSFQLQESGDAVEDSSSPPQVEPSDGIQMLEAYETEEKVRDYELDHYGVVNNAIYAQFCQHARHELLKHVGSSPRSLAQYGKWMAMLESSMDFISPLRTGDSYVVSVRVCGSTEHQLTFEDRIYKLPKRELVVSATTTAVFLDEHSNKPTTIPHEVRAKLVDYKSSSTSITG